MPFSPQPRKKGTPGPQEPKSSCGHSAFQKPCPHCTPKPQPKPAVDSTVEKTKIVQIREKIADKIAKDPKAVEKAATILSWWINKKK